MADKILTRAEVEERLWSEIGDHQTVMLGLAGGSPHHLQPMTAFCDEEGGKGVWFFVRKDNDLLKEAGSGHAAMMCVMKNRDFYACVGGTLTEDYDRTLIEKFWNPVAAAWFPEGKDDPSLTLLHLEPDDAQVWISSGNPIRFGWEVAKANITKREPDMGERAHIRF